MVAAVAENGVIGNGNAMPWRLKSDLQRFRALTWDRPVVMGRKTYLSIGKALPGRTNIVVTRDRAFSRPDVVAVPTLDAALEAARADALRRGVSEIMIIGGAEVYAALLAQATRLEITRVHATPAGDAHFPPIDEATWEEVSRTEPQTGPHDSAAISFHSYRRKAGSPDVIPAAAHAATG